MITFEQAIQIIESSVIPLTAERISLMYSLNRVLAREVVSDVDMPPFDKAAMDGYACRIADLSGELKIVEDVPAGKVPLRSIGANQCARIMTGAIVPVGANFVLMKEHAEIADNGTVRRKKAVAGENICYRGEDIKEGDVILKPGIKILPAHIAMLASIGCMHPMVFKMPGVSVISTGNELVEPEQKPETGKIRNSNGYQLVAQALQFGLTPDYLGIVTDDKPALYKMLAEAIERYQVVLISGGVSVGDYDYVPEILKQMKVELLFHGIRVKPGKHLLFGKRDNCYILGMPGNPVSSFVQFEVLGKLLLNRLMGYNAQPGKLYLPIEESYVRKKQDTMFFIPVTLTGRGTVLPVEYHGSAHIHAYTMAQGIMEVPVGVYAIKKGEMVHVRPL